MKRKIFSIILVAMFVVTLIIASVIQSPAMEKNINKSNVVKQTENKNLKTNSVIDSHEFEIAKTRAILMDEAKKAAKDNVKEIEEQLIRESEATDQEIYETSSVAVATQPSTYEEYIEVDDSSSESTYISGSSNANYLLSIENPDSSYKSYSIKLSSKDRDAAERIVMGEAGSMGYEGMALVAQCLRDAYVTHGYSSIEDTIASYGYYGSMSITPSASCKDAVRYIFDDGGAAVQHRVLVFYAPDYCSSPWHESQNYVTTYGSVRFFDRW